LNASCQQSCLLLLAVDRSLAYMTCLLEITQSLQQLLATQHGLHAYPGMFWTAVLLA
jgi:hypothetical protein